VTDRPDGLVVRTMDRQDLHWALDWARAEGWNPGLHDEEAFWAADPQGYLAAVIDDQIVGTASCVRYDDDFAFAGFYIVLPGLRARGIGRALSEAVLARAGRRILGIDGVVEQQPTYRLLGFDIAHRNIRFGGRAVGARHDGVTDLTPADLDLMSAMDAECFGAPRDQFLRAWMSGPGTLAAGVVEGDRLTGYGVVRPCHEGFKVGPLFADGAEIARAILGRLVAHAGLDATVFLDVPEPNEAGVGLAREQGLEPVFETARMYAGGDPRLPIDRIFGITSFELG
jgi:GNAT superfamily N-acetyltransferase